MKFSNNIAKNGEKSIIDLGKNLRCNCRKGLKAGSVSETNNKKRWL